MDAGSIPPLPVPVHDDHTHLNLVADADIEAWLAAGAAPGAMPGLAAAVAMLDAAEAVGVAGVVQAGTNVADSRWAAALAAADRRVLAAVAIHPNDVPALAAAGRLDAALDALDELAADPRVRAIGETGLDFHRTDESGIPAQTAGFEAHLELARRHGLALQIHDRDAHDAVLGVLGRVARPERIVLHSFSGDAEVARRALDLGCHLSFSGTVTFKNAPYLREALAIAPLDRILVETDAPYLTPHPFRGRQNEPAFIPVTLRVMAEVLGVDVAELGERVAANAVEVYGPW